MPIALRIMHELLIVIPFDSLFNLEFHFLSALSPSRFNDSGIETARGYSDELNLSEIFSTPQSPSEPPMVSYLSTHFSLLIFHSDLY